MENYGLIIRHLRNLAQLNVRETSRKIGRSAGWLSEIENGRSRAKITEVEFNRIVELLNGASLRPMFRIWVATVKNREQINTTFDGAVLRFVRRKRNLGLADAAKLLGISLSSLSKLETGYKEVSLETRNKLMAAYGYSPSSWKNFSTDPVRSKAIPFSDKLFILLRTMPESQVETVFHFVQRLAASDQAKNRPEGEQHELT